MILWWEELMKSGDTVVGGANEVSDIVVGGANEVR